LVQGVRPSSKLIRPINLLAELALPGATLTDAGVQSVRPSSKLIRPINLLAELALPGATLTDAGVVLLMGLANVQDLDLKGTRFSDF
jgi:hypothetical protein